MKRLHRFLCLLLTAAMVLSLLPAVTVSAAEDGAVVAQTVAYKETTVDVFRYTPEEFVFLGNNTPILFVLGDTAYTEESANTALNTLGFKEIADAENAHVIFVSPCGEGWCEEDVAAIQALAGNASDNYYYGTDYSAGVSEDGKFYAGRFRHYYFAEGTAVAFAKTYLDTEGVSRPIPEWYASCDVYGADFIYAEEGFEKAAVEAAWAESRYISRMYVNSMVTFPVPYYYWEEEGIELTIETIETEYEDLPKVEYYFYVPDTVNLQSETEKYPLVLLFHGSGMHPDAVAQNTTWPVLAKQEGFVVASVNGMYSTENNAHVMAALIDSLVETYAIDPGRVYASGFSKGTSESMKIAESYSGKLAGVGLYEAVYGSFPVYEPTLTMPTYSILGQDEFYTVFPRDTENAVASLDALGEVNGFSYSYDEAIGGLWGYEFDLTETLRFEEGRVVFNENSIVSEEDGVVYTKLVDGFNLSHNVHPDSTREMWDFLSQFSRNEDGSLTVEETDVFGDVSGDTWYYYPVKAAVRAGLFKGMTETEFAPGETMSRAMLVTTLYRMAGAPELAADVTNPFTDVPEGLWYHDAVLWAVQEGVVKGMTETEFAPDLEITREQIVTMLCRYGEKFGLEVAAKADLSAFEDVEAVSPFAADAIAWAVGADLVKGNADGSKLYLAPLATATRAEAATMLVRFFTLIAPVGIQ